MSKTLKEANEEIEFQVTHMIFSQIESVKIVYIGNTKCKIQKYKVNSPTNVTINVHKYVASLTSFNVLFLEGNVKTVAPPLCK